MWKRRLDCIVRSDLQWMFSLRATNEVLVELTVSISMTVLKPFSDKPEIGAKKLPAAPVGFWCEKCGVGVGVRASVGAYHR